MSAVSRHFVLAAGGTGGHLTPAFALAQELDRRGHHVALIPDARGEAIPGKPEFLPAHVLPAGRFGKNPLSWPRGIAAVLDGRRMALRLFDSFEPSAVVGFVAIELHHPERDMGEISMLAVDPEYQGGGIGTALTGFAMLKPWCFETHWK